MPDTSAESWRYSPINTLDVSQYERADATVTVTGIDVTPADDAPTLLAYPEADGVTDLHDSLMQEPVVVRIPRGVAVETPISIHVEVPSGRTMSFPRVVIETHETSEALVVVTVGGGAGGALVVPVIELHVGAASNLRYVASQELAGDAWQLGHVIANVQRDANLRAWLVATGGGYAREYVSVCLPEQGANAHVAGVYFGDEDQVLDFRSLQDHIGVRSVSDFKLKGAVVDDAHGIYTGLIRVHEGAKQTESFLGNRNLVLADGAHVDSVPNLEIVNENDIRSCGHASATGPVDEEHMFYLESRGVPTAAAQRLIVTGFFEEILEAIPVPAVAEAAREAVARKLQKVAVGE
jgi:Fe-S cluster assembly protein SufD